MMPIKSPPKHRHDGTSPLPVGMDWSPPPRKWNGWDTVWPHDFRTGWSYCVTIPSWVVLPKSRNSDPVVFYRVQIGIQSPEGITTTRGVLRRFNDFLKLFAGLKKAFPKKNLPAAPPKGLLRMKSRTLLEERRCSLELWLAKLLSDIDVSRSFIVASFLELEAAARSSFQDVEEQTPERSPASSSSTSSSLQLHPNSSLSTIVNKSDYGSDTAYETSELGTPRLGGDTDSEVGTEDLTPDEDLTNPIEKLVKYGISNIDEGLFMGQAILDQLEDFPRHRVHGRQVNSLTGKDTDNGTVEKATFCSSMDVTENMSEPEHSKVIGHARKLSTDSIGSGIISLKGSEISNSGISNSVGDGSLDYPGCAEVMGNIGNKELQFVDDTQIVLPLDQRHKMNRVLMTMHRQLVTAKTDMEDLIARLNQEMAVKDYLMTKVKDLEVELETTKQKSKENLQQAILIERERVTQMQWDMEELRRKSLEMELKLKAEKDEEVHSEPTEVFTSQERDVLMQELEATKDQLKNVRKRHEELQVKSKSDIKVLVKEVKSLRSSQVDLKHQLSQSLKEKIDTERLLVEEKQRSENAKSARRRLLHECMILRNQLQEYDIDILSEDEDKIVPHSSPMEALDLLATSDVQIGCLLAGAQLFAEEESSQPLVHDSEKSAANGKCLEFNGSETTIDEDEEEMRKMLKLVLMDNARLRKRINSVTCRALRMNSTSTKEEPPPTETVPS